MKANLGLVATLHGIPKEFINLQQSNEHLIVDRMLDYFRGMLQTAVLFERPDMISMWATRREVFINDLPAKFREFYQ